MNSGGGRGRFNRSGNRSRGRSGRSYRGGGRFGGNNNRQQGQSNQASNDREGSCLQLCRYNTSGECNRDNCGFSHAIQLSCFTQSSYKSCAVVESGGQQSILAANDNGVFIWEGGNNNRLECPFRLNNFIVRQIVACGDIIIVAGSGQVPLFPSVDVGRLVLSNGNEATLSSDEPYAHQARIEVMISSWFNSDFVVITGGVEGDVHVWHLNGGNLAISSRLVGHLRAVTGLRVSGDKSNIWSCSNDMTIRVWSLESNSCVCLLTQKDMRGFHSTPIISMCRFSSLEGDGIIVTCDESCNCQFWKEDDASKYHERVSEAAVTSVLTVDGDDNAGLVILGLINGKIEVRGCDWNLLGSYAAHEGAVLDIALMSPTQFASTGADGAVKLWSTDRNAFNQIYSS